jgi:phenol 2-monooxygenase
MLLSLLASSLTGLGVQYPADNIINVSRAGQALSTVGAGERGPETYVTRLGTNERVPLQRLMPNTGSFHVVLFAGIPRNTQSSLERLRAFFDDEGGNWEKKYPRGVVKTLSLLAATGPSATDVLGGLQSFGRTFYDSALEAHCAYGGKLVRDCRAGAVVSKDRRADSLSLSRPQQSTQ